jgi:hypothetical protein
MVPDVIVGDRAGIPTTKCLGSALKYLPRLRNPAAADKPVLFRNINRDIIEINPAKITNSL